TQPFLVTGTAHATSGVQKVQIEIRNRDTNQYLQPDLSTWSSTDTPINATVANPGAVDTTWSLGPISITQNRNLQVFAKTFALDGTRDAPRACNKFEPFSTADKTPTATITGPSGVPGTTFTVTGTASDDFGVRSLTYSVHDTNTNRYLQD